MMGCCLWQSLLNQVDLDITPECLIIFQVIGVWWPGFWKPCDSDMNIVATEIPYIYINAEPSRYSDQDKLQFSEMNLTLNSFHWWSPCVVEYCCYTDWLWSSLHCSLAFKLGLISCTVFHYQYDLTSSDNIIKRIELNQSHRCMSYLTEPSLAPDLFAARHHSAAAYQFRLSIAFIPSDSCCTYVYNDHDISVPLLFAAAMTLITVPVNHSLCHCHPQLCVP